MITNEIVRYILSGFAAFCVDCLAYFSLMQFAEPLVSKAISFVMGSCVAYFCNKYWTFGKPMRSGAEVCRFVLLYLTTIAANVSVNQMLLGITDAFFFSYLTAASVSTILNYIGQKWWVFHTSSQKVMARQD